MEINNPKLLKVILVYENETIIAEDKEAEKYQKMNDSAAVLMHGRAYNPFVQDRVNWTYQPPDAHGWWKRMKFSF